jgi:hypothetical protein
MTTIFKNTALISAALLLTACGGGGGGGDSPASTSTNQNNTSAVYGYITTTTVGHALNDEATISSIAEGTESTTANTMTNVVSVSKHTVSNSVNSMNVDTSAFSSAGFANTTSGQKSLKTGGTTWNYSRFAVFQDRQSNSNGLNTQYIVRTFPYAITQPYASAIPVSASYNTSGKAAGVYTTNNVDYHNFECSVSVAFSVTATTHQADVSLSNCVDIANNAVTYGTPGVVRLTKTLATGQYANANNPVFTATLGNVAAGTTQTLTSTLQSGHFVLGGPNAEELVGTIYIAGNSVTTNHGTKTSNMTLTFGAKK